MLRPGGRFAMFNIDPWAMPDWSIYQFFPAAQERDHRDFLPIERFTTLLADVGFHNIQASWRHFPKEEPLTDFFAYASDRHRTSQLIAISDEAYQEGLRRVQAQLTEATGQPLVIHSDLCLVRVIGTK